MPTRRPSPSAGSGRPASLGRVARLVVAVVLLLGGAARIGSTPGPAAAAVGHVAGYRATVAGFTSWYGSYDLGSLGVAWCIDHGIAAPDPALGYQRSALAGVAADTRAALAWALGRHGPGVDRVGSAALMLVAHDLMGAQYPAGRLRVDALGDRSIAGFGADAPAVLARARAVIADARAHAHLRGPWSLEAAATPPGPGAPGTLTARLTAGGQPVGGIDVAVLPDGAELAGAATVATGADGVASFPFRAVEGGYRFTLAARVPDLDLQAFEPTRARAQRVARPAAIDVTAEVLHQLPLPTTSSTTSTTATTSTTSTTSTSSTTLPPSTTSSSTTSTTSTTSSTSTTSTTWASPPTTTAPSSPPAPAAPPPHLARTGADAGALATTGAGLVLLGSSLPRSRRRPRPAAGAR